MTPTLFDFDAQIRRLLEPRFGSLGQVARHKLLFAVHRLALARTAKPAFEGRCEAWQMGPVFTDLHFQPDLSGDPGRLNDEQRGFCELVARILGAQSGRKLAARSHCRYPEWRAAKRNRSDKEITPDTILAALREVAP